MHRGNLEPIGVSAGHERKKEMVVKGISKEDFRRISLESCPTVHVREAHECFGELPNNSP